MKANAKASLSYTLDMAEIGMQDQISFSKVPIIHIEIDANMNEFDFVPHICQRFLSMNNSRFVVVDRSKNSILGWIKSSHEESSNPKHEDELRNRNDQILFLVEHHKVHHAKIITKFDLKDIPLTYHFDDKI